MARSKQLGHVAEQEGEQQGADVGAIHISVCQQDDLRTDQVRCVDLSSSTCASGAGLMDRPTAQAIHAGRLSWCMCTLKSMCTCMTEYLTGPLQMAEPSTATVPWAIGKPKGTKLCSDLCHHMGQQLQLWRPRGTSHAHNRRALTGS